jgi:stage V sporulation protein R
VDYVIEFARGIDNLVGYHEVLYEGDAYDRINGSHRLNYYFDVFLQKEKNVSITDYISEIDRFNQCTADYGEFGEREFFTDILERHPEFDTLLEKHRQSPRTAPTGIFFSSCWRIRTS